MEIYNEVVEGMFSFLVPILQVLCDVQKSLKRLINPICCVTIFLQLDRNVFFLSDDMYLRASCGGKLKLFEDVAEVSNPPMFLFIFFGVLR